MEVEKLDQEFDIENLDEDLKEEVDKAEEARKEALELHLQQLAVAQRAQDLAIAAKERLTSAKRRKDQKGGYIPPTDEIKADVAKVEALAATSEKHAVALAGAVDIARAAASQAAQGATLQSS